jgi:hypothetical protein
MFQISYLDHTIPDTSLSTISLNKVFYYFNNSLFSYDISSKTHLKLVTTEKPSFLFSTLNTHLCFVNANILNLFNLSKEIQEIKLKDIPIKIIKFKESVGFLYKNSLEILNYKKESKKLILIEFGINVKDISNSDEFTIILTEEGRLFKMRNIFVANGLFKQSEIKLYNSSKALSLPSTIRSSLQIDSQAISLSNFTTSPLTTLRASPSTIRSSSPSNLKSSDSLASPQVDSNENRLNNVHFTSNSSLLLIFENKVENYNLIENSIDLEYSLKIDCKNNLIFDNFLINEDSLIHLDKAPYLILKDKIMAISKALNSHLILSLNRIYILNELIDKIDKKVENSTNTFINFNKNGFTIDLNPNLIKIPDFITNPEQKEKFLKNEIKIKKYEILLKEISEIEKKVNEREIEILKIFENLNENIKNLEIKKTLF